MICVTLPWQSYIRAQPNRMFLSPLGSSPVLLQLQTHLVRMMHLTDVCGH